MKFSSYRGVARQLALMLRGVGLGVGGRGRGGFLFPVPWASLSQGAAGIMRLTRVEAGAVQTLGL
jgi:hypothetical protein